MNELSIPPGTIEAGQAAAEQSLQLDSRRPLLLDHEGALLTVVHGYVDIYVIDQTSDETGPRRHLLRIEPSEIIPALRRCVDVSGARLQIIAIAGPGTRARVTPLGEIASADALNRWISKLSRTISAANPSWDMPELPAEGATSLSADDRCRGPMHGIAWVTVTSGTVSLAGTSSRVSAGDPPLPLTAGLWVKSESSDCTLNGTREAPQPPALWAALEKYYLHVLLRLEGQLVKEKHESVLRLRERDRLTEQLARESVERLSDIIVQSGADHEVGRKHGDPLLSACQAVCAALQAPLEAQARPNVERRDFADVLDIARAGGLRVRQTLLRDGWWLGDHGPLLAWRGEANDPVALIPVRRGRYLMIDGASGKRRRVDRALAAELGPQAVTFYPTFPSAPLSPGDFLSFLARYAHGNISRILFAVAAIGALSLVIPILTSHLVNSIIPRTELDQLAFCALAIATTSVAIAGMQAMESFAMLRLESIMDWRLQAAVLDRVLRLPTSLFRKFTVGDFVDRTLGIDAARRVLTGNVLHGVMSVIVCWFSLGLMFYYDVRLALIAFGLTALRTIAILAASAVQLRQEQKSFSLHGKLSGYVLQLLTGVAKLRVAAATERALSNWARQFATQRQHFVASQKAGNTLGVFEAAYPIIATAIIFAIAASTQSRLMTQAGTFIAFFAAFGQSLASMGAWARGVGQLLVAVPSLSRLRPLIETPTEMPEERKVPGALSGAVEFSRVIFRYLPESAPVLDNVSFKVAPGEFVAIVGPSGSGKSSLFRLLLGFERPETGGVFFDGKSIDSLDTSAVRRQLGVVLQNAKLATGSIYENICAGVTMPVEQAWEAARMAGIEADIKAMPMGMNTLIAEGVSTLSGGQRQRIMIARAIARRPRIMLFDEATSALDNQSQAVVTSALGQLNVTRIIIAHRLSTVRQADRIVMLVGGKVVETGQFDELVARGGPFAAFAQRQLL